MTRKGAAGASRWLIAERTEGRMDVLTIDGGGDLVLPVFSFREEAEMYARLQPMIPDWGPREFSPGELVSVLCGPLSGVARVALDPLPEVCGASILNLLCVRREAFVLSLVGEGTSAASAGTSGRPAEAPVRRPRSAAPFTPARAATNPPSLWRDDGL